MDNLFGYVDRTDHGLHLGTTTPGPMPYVALSITYGQGQKIKNNIKSISKQKNYEEN